MNPTRFSAIIRGDLAQSEQPHLLGTPAAHRQTVRPPPGAALLLLLIALAPIQSWAAEAAEQTFGRTSLSVAAVQMRSTRDLSQNVARVCAAIAECATQGVRVVVFPECALTGYFEDVVTNLTSSQITSAEEQVANVCRRDGIYAVVGSAYREREKLFDSALVIAPTGQVLERYHKVQLAEDWPEPGDHLSVFKVDGVKCSVLPPWVNLAERWYWGNSREELTRARRS